jgi:hypothetical protein
VLARELKPTDQKIIDISYNDFKLQTPADTEPTREGSENIIAEFPTNGSEKIDDYVDTSLLDDLKKNGFFTAMQQKYGQH